MTFAIQKNRANGSRVHLSGEPLQHSRHGSDNSFLYCNWRGTCIFCRRRPLLAQRETRLYALPEPSDDALFLQSFSSHSHPDSAHHCGHQWPCHRSRNVHDTWLRLQVCVSEFMLMCLCLYVNVALLRCVWFCTYSLWLFDWLHKWCVLLCGVWLFIVLKYVIPVISCRMTKNIHLLSIDYDCSCFCVCVH